MVKGTSCFAQALSLVKRHEFARIVKECRAEKGAKGFSCWDQFVSMLFCQLGGANSLREICGGLFTALGKMVHLGMREAPKKSTLAYANEHRPWQVYENVFYRLLEQCREEASTRKKKFRFKNPLRSLDSTTIDLCLSVFDWAHFRRTKGAVKIHMMLDHQGYLPCFAHVTDGKVHDVTVAKTLDFEAGTVVAMDRGYNDYRLFASWHERGVFFVTRMKDNAVYEVREMRTESEKKHILRDETIRLTGPGAEDKCPHDLRRVVVWDEKNERELVLLTNLFSLASSTIATIYKERWQIELFFKAVKQNLKIKTFVGTSENAVHIQIWTALIALLILKFLQLKSTFPWSLSNLAALFRFNLLTYRDLWAWISNPFDTPPLEPIPEQMSFALPGLGQQTT